MVVRSRVLVAALALISGGAAMAAEPMKPAFKVVF